MAKHFTIEITDESFTFTPNTEAIAAEAALDGIYVVRTSLPEQALNQLRRGAALQETSPMSSGSSASSTANWTYAPSVPAGRPGARPRVPAQLSYYISWT